MTTEEKLLKLKKLADAMYYAAQQLTTDASRLHKAMDEYHKFIIHESKENVSEDLEKAARKYAGIPEDSLHDLKYCVQDKKAKYDAVLYGANWQKEQMLANAVDFTEEHNIACVLASECLRNHGWFNRERVFNDLFRHLSCVDKLFEGKFCGKTKVIVIKEE